MNNKVLEIIDPDTLSKLHDAGFRVVKSDTPTPAMMSALVAIIPDIYSQGTEAYYHHLWSKMMLANDTDKLTR
jgi:hypothetical protein